MPPSPATLATYGMAERLPAKFANNLKLFSSNGADRLRNPLKQGISRNPMPWKNFHPMAKLSASRKTKPLGSQASESLVIPVDR